MRTASKVVCPRIPSTMPMKGSYFWVCAPTCLALWVTFKKEILALRGFWEGRHDLFSQHDATIIWQHKNFRFVTSKLGFLTMWQICQSVFWIFAAIQLVMPYWCKPLEKLAVATFYFCLGTRRKMIMDVKHKGEDGRQGQIKARRPNKNDE